MTGGLNALIPLERIDSVAHPDEVKQVVVNRSGSILSASTILKSDFFSNLQKMTLPEYVCYHGDVHDTHARFSRQADRRVAQLPSSTSDSCVNLVWKVLPRSFCWPSRVR